MQFLIDHYDEILALLGTLYALVSGVVALTPSKEDDAFLMRFAQRLSFLAPRNVPQRFSLPGFMPGKPEDPIGPMLVLLLCCAPLLGACDQLPPPADAAALGRILACKGCAALGGDKGAACLAALGCDL